MVDSQRNRYVGGAEGAPPLPPPGGYRGAQRASAGLDAVAGLPAASGGVTYIDPAASARKPVNAIGLVAYFAYGRPRAGRATEEAA